MNENFTIGQTVYYFNDESDKVVSGVFKGVMNISGHNALLVGGEGLSTPFPEDGNIFATKLEALQALQILVNDSKAYFERKLIETVITLGNIQQEIDNIE